MKGAFHCAALPLMAAVASDAALRSTQLENGTWVFLSALFSLFLPCALYIYINKLYRVLGDLTAVQNTVATNPTAGG